MSQLPWKIIIILTWFIAFIVIISKCVGQFYPFSEFPMYSSFPSNANIYYLTDDKDKVVYTTEVIGLDAARFKQIIEHHAEHFGGSHEHTIISNSAKESLAHLLRGKDSINLVEKYGVLKVWQRSFALNADTLQISDRELSRWP